MKLLRKSLIAVLLIGATTFALPSSSNASTTPYLNLHIRILKTVGAAPQIINLTCTPDSKTLPRAHAICRALLKAGFKSFKPVPPNTACTMIYGGDQTATIKGRWGSKVVNAKFSRTNGCEITRWANLSFLLGKF